MTPSWIWVSLFAAAALFSLFELFRQRTGTSAYLNDSEAHAAHMAMNGAMAMMLVPEAPPGWMWASLIPIGILGLVLAARLPLHLRRGASAKAGASLYHLIGAGAMFYAMRGVFAAGAGMRHCGGMAAHAGADWLATGLAMLFLADAIATAVMVMHFPSRLLAMGGAPADAAAVADLRISAVPHVIMDAGMAAMLLAGHPMM